MQRLRQYRLIIAIACVLVIVLGTWLYLGKSPGGSEDRIVLIPPNSGTELISQKLMAAGVVRSAVAFRYYTVLTGQARKLKAGEYAFAPGATLQQITAKLVSGRVLSHTVTIPEGFTLTQIAEKLASAGLVAEEDFLKLAQSGNLNQAWDLPGESLEGFLFPDTYQLIKGTDTEEIIRRMVDRFKEKVGKEVVAAGKEQGLNLLQLITLASIIEREVKAKPEQKIVASIFYNRLHKRKRLESCSTVLYAQGRVSGDLSLEDLYTSSPYNTYRHRGLPPGPIGNPGISAIQAAAYPAQTEYMFFVVRPDGTHVFSTTFEEHKRAKWKQKRVRRPLPLTPQGKPRP